MNVVGRVLRHVWRDGDDARRLLGDDTLVALEAQVAASEAQHSGEICLCVEAGLPWRYLWRHVRHGQPIDAVVRERAMSMFGKLRVWDTERNNGVLVYVQLTEQRIEIVADRAVSLHLAPGDGRALLDAAGEDLRAGLYRQGLTRIIDGLDTVLRQHFPSDGAPRVNALPDGPDVR